MWGSRKHPYHPHYIATTCNFTKLKHANLVERTSILRLSRHETRSWSLSLYFFKCFSVPENSWNSQNLASLWTKLLICLLPKESHISNGCAKILEILEGRGRVIRQIPSVGLVWIFSGTTKLSVTLRLEQQSCRTMTKLSSLSYSDRFLSRTLVKTLGTLTQ